MLKWWIMKTKILTILRYSNDYISGQALCEKLQVSRTAVWKVINQLKEEGYNIESVNNKGYKITGYPDVLSECELDSVFAADKDQFANKIYCYDTIDSTNNQAKKEAENDACDKSLFVAECQTGGKGRRGRTWISPPKSGIFMSYLLKPDIMPTQASTLTLVAALAVAKGITNVVQKYGKAIECNIKWPNDIVLNKKKIVGILTELSAELDCVNYVVVGIGINVNNKEFPEEIKDTATSIYNETKLSILRSEIIACIDKEFAKYYETFLETKDMSNLIDEYNAMLINKDNMVKVIYGNKEITGVAKGIENDGALLVESEGEIKKIIAGEVSVRGLYGYT